MNDKHANCYSCDTCGRAIFTVDRTNGVTPMFLACRKTEGCRGRMMSPGYPSDDWFELTPVWYEWVAPASGNLDSEPMELRKLDMFICYKDLPTFEATPDE